MVTIKRAAGGQLPAILLFGTVCVMTIKGTAREQLPAMLLHGTVCVVTIKRAAGSIRLFGKVCGDN